MRVLTLLAGLFEETLGRLCRDSASKCAAIASYFMAAANSIPICALSAFCILAEIIMLMRELYE